MSLTRKPDAASSSTKSAADSPVLVPPQTISDGNWVFVQGGDVNLLLPAAEIVSLASSRDLILPSQSTHSCGYVEFERQRYPIFCFNKALQLQATLIASHEAILLLNYQGYCFGMSCCDVEKLDGLTSTLNPSSGAVSSLIFYKVPVSMSSRKQPFTEFAVIKNCATGLSSTAALLALLRFRGVTLSVTPDHVDTVLQGAG